MTWMILTSLKRLAAETPDPATGMGAPPLSRHRTEGPTSSDLVPYAAPFTARALAQMGWHHGDLGQAAE